MINIFFCGVIHIGEELKKKLIKKIILILGPTGILIIVGLFVLVACLFTFNFFGSTVTDGYIEGNAEYAERYIAVVRKNVKEGNGYVSLSRILYFYLANDKLTFDEIYTDNLDPELKQERTISDVCSREKYKKLYVCSSSEIEKSGQVNTIQNKPLTLPLDKSSFTITSYFKEERVIYGKANVHSAWDFAAPAQTEVKSSCAGKVIQVSFPYSSNTPDPNDGGGGNHIKVQCDGDDNISILYAHLFPNSSKVKVGDTVSQGQVLAGVGTTGNSTGNHLHFQVYKDNNVVDAMSLVDFSGGASTTKPKEPVKPSIGGFTNRADCYAHWNDVLRRPVNGVIVDDCASLPE